MFPTSSRHRRIKVPACRSCNGGHSEDEEYLRTVLVAMQWTPSPAVEQLFREKVAPSFARDNTRLRRSLLEAMQDVSIQTDEGTVDTAIVKMDADRMDRVAAKMVKGLYFHLRRRRMPEGTSFRFHWLPKEPMLEVAMRGHLLNVDPEVFSCRYVMTESKPHASIWWLLFYRQILYVVTAHEQAAVE
jgi:hypothetical protein